MGVDGSFASSLSGGEVLLAEDIELESIFFMVHQLEAFASKSPRAQM